MGARLEYCSIMAFKPRRYIFSQLFIDVDKMITTDLYVYKVDFIKRSCGGKEK